MLVAGEPSFRRPGSAFGEFALQLSADGPRNVWSHKIHELKSAFKTEQNEYAYLGMDVKSRTIGGGGVSGSRVVLKLVFLYYCLRRCAPLPIACKRE